MTKSPFHESPVMPEMFDGEKPIRFRCGKGISCFNACCKSADISLTPYDIIRLKKRLGMNSSEFLENHTVPFEMEKDGMAGIRLKSSEGSTACPFMTDEGCSVYEDRPTACRYYPLAHLSMRKQDEYVDRSGYALVVEKHCLGHFEEREILVDDYRKEQDLELYDEASRGWRQLILKKKSSGPSIGKPSGRSLQLFFTACYDIDRFRDFVYSDGFIMLFDLQEEEYLGFEEDEKLLEFSYRFLRQVLFGENTIPLREEIADARRDRALRRRSMEGMDEE